MLGLLRKSEYFTERINKQISDRLEKLSNDDKNDLMNVKECEDEREIVMKNFEEDLKNLELKYDSVLRNLNVRRNEKIQKEKEIFSDFWLRVLGNNKTINEFITESDRNVLKHLKDISSMKLEDGNSFKLIFEFEQNEYFTNTIIEKSYHIGRDLLLDKVESSAIEWKEGKNLCFKTVSKNLINKNTGEKKSVDHQEPILTFFNFFSNIRIPSVEEMKKLDFDTEKEIGMQLDFEYSLGIEFTDEIIPNALEYFVGVTYQTEEELEEYMHDMMSKQNEKKKGKTHK